MPRFSVIMPAHNASNRIHIGLESIKNQTFKDYELIVICDDCYDVTEDIAKYYGARTKKICARSDGTARTTGLEMARGEWILFIDDDDHWLHELAFKQINDKLNELNNELDVLAFSFIWRNRLYATPQGSYERTYWWAVWNKCWRREFIKDVKFPPLPRHSDVEFTKGVWAKNPRIVDWDMPLYYYNYRH